jgi:glycosyltransferase involved in cell wall biosynthesis
MSWQPNLEGIRWFVDEVAPLLPLEYSTTIVGGFPDDNSIDIHSNSRIKWVGRVDDLSPYYIDASVFIAPLKSGSGIKLKLLNSLAHAIPTVTTSIGIEGFPVGWGNAIKIGDTPEDFVKKIIELCESQFHWESCRDNGLKYLSYNFSTARFDDWIGKNLND